MNIVPNPSVTAVKALLAAARLPVDDITPDAMAHFLGAWSGPHLQGVVGIEPYGDTALLRSLAVAESRRGTGLGSALLAHAERHARESGCRTIYLLTTSAQPYFEKRGYTVTPRDAAPEAIRGTSQFSTLCPASAVLMVKYLQGGCT